MKIKKEFFTLLCCAAGLLCRAQLPMPELPLDETGQAKWEAVVEVPGVGKDALYDRAIEWIHKHYKNPSGVLKKQDKAGGEIEGKARFALKEKDAKGKETVGAAIVEYTFTLKFKDGRFKYEIYRVHWLQASYYDVSRWSDVKQNNFNEARFRYYLEQTLGYMDDWDEKISNALKTDPAIKKDDW
jgi:hypothetical protein